jgi:hypothetical protein
MNTKCKIKNAYDESALQYDSFVDCGNSHNSIAESPAVYKLLTDIEIKHTRSLLRLWAVFSMDGKAWCKNNWH